MPMSMSMMWMRMPGQTWAGDAASFMGMWVVMTVVMMGPSLLPVARGVLMIQRISTFRSTGAQLIAQTLRKSSDRPCHSR